MFSNHDNNSLDKNASNIRVKVFKNGPSKICERQPLKNLKCFKGCLPQILLGLILNTLNITLNITLNTLNILNITPSKSKKGHFQDSVFTSNF